MQTFDNVDDYIAGQSAEARPRLRELRAAIRDAVPDAVEVISYGMPTYRLQRPVVYFGAARHHCALYGAPLADFADELQGYEVSGTKGTLRFPLDRPIPSDLVRRLAIAGAERARGTRKPGSNTQKN